MRSKIVGASLVCAALGLFSIAGAAQADDTLKVTTPGAAPATVATATPDPLDKVVCRMQPPPLGTRIGRAAVCQTQREWNAMEGGAQSRFHDVQMRNNVGNPGNNGAE
jgi:hypothetical protein